MVSIFQAAIGGVVFCLLYKIYWKLIVGASYRRMIKKHRCGPLKQYPDWDPIFGTQTFLKNIRWAREHTILENIQQRYADMGRNTFFLNHTGLEVITTIEPENLKTIQAIDFKKWGLPERRIQAFLPFLGAGIFSTNGQEWQHSREMLRPNFVRSQVRDLETFEVHVGHMIDSLPRDERTVNLSKLFFMLTIDSATEFLFGESTNCLAPGASSMEATRFAEAFNRGQGSIATKARAGIFWFLWGHDRQLKRDTKVVHDFVDYFVSKALTRHAAGKTDPDRYIFAEALVSSIPQPTPLAIRSELLNILLAGRDTTASLLTNVFYTISRRQDILAKLCTEIASVVGFSERPTYENLREMKYLRAVLNESLRLYPVVPVNSRQAHEDTVLPVGGGEDGRQPVFVKKGMVVNWSCHAMHRRKDFYGADSEMFRPERWIDQGDVKGLRPGWEYLPFNGGARICLGQQFALTEASYTTVRLLQAFRAIESRDDRPWTEWLHLTCVGRYGASVGLTPR